MSDRANFHDAVITWIQKLTASLSGDSPRVLRYSSTKSRPQEVYVELEQ